MDDFLFLLGDLEDVPLRETRVLWDRTNPLTHFNDVEFRLNFRMTKASLINLVEMIRPDLDLPNQRGLPLNPVQQTCLLMQYFATGDASKRRMASFHLQVVLQVYSDIQMYSDVVQVFGRGRYWSYQYPVFRP